MTPQLLVASLSAGLGIALVVAAYLYVSRLRMQAAHRFAAARRKATSARLEAVRQSQAAALNEYWRGVRAATVPMIITTPAGEIVAASPALVELLGYENEQDLCSRRAEALYVDPLERAQRFGKALEETGSIRNSEFRLRKRDGGEIDTLVSARPIRQNGSVYYEGLITDITALRTGEEQRRHLQAQLDLARKLEVIGQLASGIAHEINTPIQFIGDNIHFLKRAFTRVNGPAVPTEAARQALVKDIDDAFAGSLEGVDRVAEIVRAMKEFAHPGDTDKTATDLNQVIQTTLTVARSEYKHAADIVLNLGEIPPVDCRRAEINKVLLNLIVNAAHAIESSTNGSGKGTITIQTERERSDVLITIADNGCGIPQAVIKRIFDPFFTTKPVGKGTGQGLAIARSIVMAHGGDLDVTSKVGVGTTFYIRLPLPEAPEQVQGAPDAELESAIG